MIVGNLVVCLVFFIFYFNVFKKESFFFRIKNKCSFVGRLGFRDLSDNMVVI